MVEHFYPNAPFRGHFPYLRIRKKTETKFDAQFDGES